MKTLVSILAFVSSTVLFADCANLSGTYKNNKDFNITLVQKKCNKIIVQYKDLQTGKTATDKIKTSGEKCHDAILFPTTHTKYKNKKICVKYSFNGHVLEAKIYSRNAKTKKYNFSGQSKYYRGELAGENVMYELYEGYKSLTDIDMNAMFLIE